MNHLAHFHLAGKSKDLIIGNYIADFVKGKQKQSFSEGIKKGIEMHRKIDAYTDAHPLVLEAVEILRPTVGRYSSVAIDVLYDHFLAKHWQHYHPKNLQSFANDIYQLLKIEYENLPSRSQQFYQYMIYNNILVEYQNLKSLQMVFNGMSQRTRFPSQLDKSVQALTENYDDLKSNFEQFFPELMKEFNALH